MAAGYYYYPGLPLVVEETQQPQSFFSAPRALVCAPVLSFVGGSAALVTGFFLRNSVITWVIIAVGGAMCIVGVLLARKNVLAWRAKEMERLRDMWRAPAGPPPGAPGYQANNGPAFDVPMFELDAIHTQSRGLEVASRDQECVFGLPVVYDEASHMHRALWTTPVLVYQPYAACGAPGSPAPAALYSAGSGALGGGEGGGEDDVPLRAPSLSLVRVPSLSLPPAPASGSGVARSSRTGLVGELLSLLTGGGAGTSTPPPPPLDAKPKQLTSGSVPLLPLPPVSPHGGSGGGARGSADGSAAVAPAPAAGGAAAAQWAPVTSPFAAAAAAGAGAANADTATTGDVEAGEAGPMTYEELQVALGWRPGGGSRGASPVRRPLSTAMELSQARSLPLPQPPAPPGLPAPPRRLDSLRRARGDP